EEARSLGLEDKLVITMGSDFGRTNKYNDGAGKDHWPIGSMMFIAKSRISGNRIVGATDEQFKALKIDPATLAVDKNNSNPNAVRITPAHIHRSLRRLAGVEVELGEAATKFPLKGSDIELFNPPITPI
ncbi:MAG: DUF1501 domain-containing protein, partial [Thiohalomonadales bacterium]